MNEEDNGIKTRKNSNKYPIKQNLKNDASIDDSLD